MRNYIFEFDQEVVLRLRLKLNELLFLDYVANFISKWINYPRKIVSSDLKGFLQGIWALKQDYKDTKLQAFKITKFQGYKDTRILF